jgi:hypothetical protein
MPPKRKALGDADGNTQATASTTSKKSKTTPKSELDDIPEPFPSHVKTRWAHVSGSKNLYGDYFKSMKDPAHAFEFMCICNPLKSGGGDDWDEEEDEEAEGDDEEKAKKCDRGKTCPCTKTAASLPEHPYTFTRAGLARNTNANDMVDLRDPDTMGMYTYNDHMAYGCAKVVQNLLL